MRKRSIFVMLLLLAGAAHAQTQMYRWVDKEGKVTVGKAPPAGVKAQPVTVQPSPGKGAPSATRIGPGQAAASGASVNDATAQDALKRDAQSR